MNGGLPGAWCRRDPMPKVGVLGGGFCPLLGNSPLEVPSPPRTQAGLDSLGIEDFIKLRQVFRGALGGWGWGDANPRGSWAGGVGASEWHSTGWHPPLEAPSADLRQGPCFPGGCGLLGLCLGSI